MLSIGAGALSIWKKTINLNVSVIQNAKRLIREGSLSEQPTDAYLSFA